jgi:ubiquinone/menaquinone biosynthesis C-methylase UbiE
MMQYTELQSIMDNYFQQHGAMHVLEAGCGSGSRVTFGENAFITGIDISEKQLERNKIANEKILGDIQNHPFNERIFDVIICWDVLEHLEFPLKAVDEFIKAVKKDGLIVLAMPMVTSFKGMTTKFSPHWFHIFVYKYLLGHPDAGKYDNAPFPTTLRMSIAPGKLTKYFESRGFSIEYFYSYEGGQQAALRNKFRVQGYSWKAIKLLINLFTLGLISPDCTDYILVVRKTVQMGQQP